MNRRRSWRFIVDGSGLLILFFAFILSFPGYTTADSASNRPDYDINNSSDIRNKTLQFPAKSSHLHLNEKGEWNIHTIENRRKSGVAAASGAKDGQITIKTDIERELDQDAIQLGKSITRKKRSGRDHLTRPMLGRALDRNVKKPSNTKSVQDGRDISPKNLRKESNKDRSIMNHAGTSENKETKGYTSASMLDGTKIKIYVESSGPSRVSNLQFSLEKSKNGKTESTNVSIDIDSKGTRRVDKTPQDLVTVEELKSDEKSVFKTEITIGAAVKKSESGVLQALIQKQELEAERYMESIEKKYSLLCHEEQVAAFDEHVGRGSGKSEEAPEDSKSHFAEFQEEIQTVIKTRFEHWRNFSSPLLRKEIKTLMQDGQGPMPDEDYKRMHDLGDSMETSYKEAFVCEYGRADCDCENGINCALQLDPEIQEIFLKSRNPEELKHYWTAWHDTVGTRITSTIYEEFVMLNNEYARGNNFRDYAAIWADEYNEWTDDWTSEKFRDNVLHLWEQLKPYYKILHAYVRMKLSRFPNYVGTIERCGPIPVHLLGNMFGQSWTNVAGITKPNPNVMPLDATAEMRKQQYTPKKMFDIADEFYQSLGLKNLPATFWNSSVFTKPPNSDMVCHPAAHDLCLGRLGEDYRITMCTAVSQSDLVTIHHELGHIQYMMQYAHLRFAFRGASNPGFDESVGDVLAMSVTTPEHLQCYLGLNLGLKLKCNDNSQTEYPVTETDINYLYLTALESLAFFPFAITMESWRWLIMEDKLKAKDFNTKWWEMRKDIQGVIPPTSRPPSTFDAGAKYHIINHASYLRYFMSTVFQFDFYESLCKASGQYNPDDPDGKPLYKCDFTGSKEAGSLLASMLKKGGRVPWPKALKEVTGREFVTVEPLLKYFMPLFDKLKQLLKEGGEDDCLEKPWS